MKITYDFPNIRLFGNSKLYVENHKGSLSLKSSGLAAIIFKPIFKQYFKVYERMQPVAEQGGADIYTLYVPPIPSKAHAIHFENFIRRWLFGKRIPLAATIAITGKCQLTCGHCSVPEKPTHSKELTTEEIKRVVRESLALNLTNITFTGGEPLLRDDLEEIISSIPQDRALTLVFTNGLGLTPQRAKSLKAAGMAGIQISLDSPEPEEHDKLRGKTGAFNAVEKGVSTALNENLLVGLSTYATNEFVEQNKLSRMAELGAAWGVHEITVFDAIPTGKIIHREDMMLNSQNKGRLIKESRELVNKYRKKMHVITQSWTNSNSGFARFVGCLAGNYQFHISSTGDFRPCDFTPFSIGNVREESVQNLWAKITSHPEYRKFRHACRMQTQSFRRQYISPMINSTGKTLLTDNILPKKKFRQP